MSNPALTAILGIDPSGFLSGITASGASLKDLDRAVKLSAAEVAAFEQGLKGGGSAEQIAQLDALKGRHRDLQIELKNTARQMAAFQAAADLAPKETGPKLPDDKERYDAYWKRLEEQERSRRAHEGINGVSGPAPAATDDSAAYEAHWKRLEEKERSQRADEAIKSGGEASDAAQKDKLQKLKRFQRERDELVRQLRVQEENEKRSPSESAENSSRGDGSEEKKNSNRMRDQELAHSGRSVVDMLAAGVDPLRALEMEGPRLVQAFGGGLGALLGIGGAIVGMATLVGKTIEFGQAANEMHRNFGLALNGDTSQGQQSVEALRKRVTELDEQLAQDAVPTGIWSRFKQGAVDRLALSYRQIGAFKDALTGNGSWKDWMSSEHENAGDQRKKDVGDAEDKRSEKLKQVAELEKQINDLQVDGFHHGQDSVRVAALELERKQKIADVEAGYGLPNLRQQLKTARTPEEKARLQRELDDKSQASTAGIDEVNREFDIKVNVAQIDIDKNAVNRASATLQAGLGHIALTNPDGSTNQMRLPPGFMRNNVNLQKREADRAAAVTELADARNHGGDTKAAQVNLDQAEAALRDGAIDEATKTPEQRQKDADAFRVRQRAEGTLMHRGTLDADRGESRVNDADKNGSVILDATKSGTVFNSRDNVHSPTFDELLHKPGVRPNIAEQVRSGSENAGKGDGNAWKGENIVSAVNDVKEALGGAFKNR